MYILNKMDHCSYSTPFGSDENIENIFEKTQDFITSSDVRSNKAR